MQEIESSVQNNKINVFAIEISPWQTIKYFTIDVG